MWLRMARCAHGWRPHAASSRGWRAICRRCRRGRPSALAVGETHHRRESLGWAHYLLSSVAYQRNDLPAAEAHARAVEEIRYLGRPMAYVQSAFIYASICQARGLPDQARQKLDLAFDFLRETRSDGLLPLAQAFQAELAAMQGDLGAANHWATTIGPHVPLTAMPYFYAPQLALPKILLAQDTPASREQAAEALSRLHAFVTCHPQHALHHRGAGVGGLASPRAGERAERARSPGTSRDPGAARRLRARLRRPGAEHGRSAGAAGRQGRCGHRPRLRRAALARLRRGSVPAHSLSRPCPPPHRPPHRRP